MRGTLHPYHAMGPGFLFLLRCGLAHYSSRLQQAVRTLWPFRRSSFVDSYYLPTMELGQFDGACYGLLLSLVCLIPQKILLWQAAQEDSLYRA